MRWQNGGSEDRHGCNIRAHGVELPILSIGSDYTDVRETRLIDQVVVEHGTLPLDDLYFAFRQGSVNLGEVDCRALVAGAPQTLVRNPQGPYRPLRIGDAVQSRNVHAAIYDALRLCLHL